MHPQSHALLDDSLWQVFLRSLRRTGPLPEDELYHLAHQPGHLNTEELFAYVENTLEPKARARITRHAAGCAFCLHQLAQTARLLQPRLFQELASFMMAVMFTAYAQRQVRRLPAPARFDSRPQALSAEAIPFTFDEDPDLTVTIHRDEDGRHRLDLIHRRWPAGTLFQVTLQGEDAPDSWVRYGVLRTGFNQPILKLCVEKAMAGENGPCDLVVRGIRPEQLPAHQANLLWESFQAIAEDDPAAVSAWQRLARKTIQLDEAKASNERMAREVHNVFRRIAGDNSPSSYQAARTADVWDGPFTVYTARKRSAKPRSPATSPRKRTSRKQHHNTHQ